MAKTILMSMLIVVGMCAAVSYTSTTRPHRLHHMQESLPVAVDGASDPNSIPDALAYSHFILATAERSDATPERRMRRDAYLRAAGLSREDRASYVRALEGVAEQLQALSEQASAVAAKSGSPTVLASLRTQRSSLLELSRSRVINALSHEGGERLEAHIRERVKKRIVVYGDAPR